MKCKTETERENKERIASFENVTPVGSQIDSVSLRPGAI